MWEGHLKGGTGTAFALVALVAIGLWLVCGRSVVKEVVYPVENFRSWMVRSPAAWFKAVLRPARTAAENRRLKAEAAALQMLEKERDALAAENQRFRKLLDYRTASTNSWICAPVLSRDGAGGVRGLMRVGRGSADGVRTNATVAVPDGLVGRVEQVTRRTADVRLLTHPSMKVACEILADDSSLGVVRGILEGGGTRIAHSATGLSILYLVNPLRMQHMKRRPALPRNAKIITSGLGGVFPRGLTVGYLIDGCEEDETQLEREGAVMPAVDFPSLEDVFIRRED
jgi:rod shape-determining protein MreC